MKHESEEFFKFFEGDATSLGVLMYLGFLLSSNEHLLISMPELCQKTGLGRHAMGKILQKLEDEKFFSKKVLPNKGMILTFSTSKSAYIRQNQRTDCTTISHVRQNQRTVRQNQRTPAKISVLTPHLTPFSKFDRLYVLPKLNTFPSPKAKQLETKLETKTKLKSETKSWLEPKPSTKPKPRPKRKIEVLIPEDVKALAKEWFDWASAKSPSTKFSYAKFELSIFKMTQGTQKDLSDIRAMFEFIQSDEKDEGFCYAKNFISPVGWDKKWSNDLSKLDNCFNSMSKARKSRTKDSMPSDYDMSQIF